MLEWHNETVGPMNWEKAIDYCEKLGDGWRLPTIQELISIIDFTKSNPASSIEMKPRGYWSSTTYVYSSDYVWYVNFNDGYVDYYDKSYILFVCAVRDGQLN